MILRALQVASRMQPRFINILVLFFDFYFRWITYKQNLVKDVISRHGHFRSNTTIHDVPYSIRITDEIDSKL